MVPSKRPTMRVNVHRVYMKHIAAIRHALKDKQVDALSNVSMCIVPQVFIMTDEFTDSTGHAIVNVILGSAAWVYLSVPKGRTYLCNTISMICQGTGGRHNVSLDDSPQNNGVESTEVAKVVNDTVSDLGIKTNTGCIASIPNVLAFVTDSASVLKAAFENVLAPLYTNAIHVPCISHALNNVIKEISAPFRN
eukprot:TRINITY_DN2633_c0_g1_i1.p1 TRINITY_DN2633_c0_g1~~TRINITY_DN2633_c0_g1_i1.p1  ORF type:complete len:193 (+),score=17.75 TRINITY_DN2633_c0_g1_i1:73-651(+)